LTSHEKDGKIVDETIGEDLTMPRGVPKAGFRNRTTNSQNNANYHPSVGANVKVETDLEIAEKLKDRFEILETMTNMAIDGSCRALIVSGPAGLGKSYTVEQALKRVHTAVTCKGYIRPTGLYKLLYANKNPGNVIVFDDCDNIFFDEVSINLLKAVLDSNSKRLVTYMTEGSLISDETGERLPNQFEFEGTIIFITNYDFDDMIQRGHKLAPHVQALLSRSHYIDLAMKTKRDYIVRIKQVIAMGMLDTMTGQEIGDCVHFIESNCERLRELSLRMALKIAAIRSSNPGNWKKIVSCTCLKNN
jgi:hypothetical protein